MLSQPDAQSMAVSDVLLKHDLTHGRGFTGLTPTPRRVKISGIENFESCQKIFEALENNKGWWSGAEITVNPAERTLEINEKKSQAEHDLGTVSFGDKSGHVSVINPDGSITKDMNFTDVKVSWDNL